MGKSAQTIDFLLSLVGDKPDSSTSSKHEVKEAAVFEQRRAGYDDIAIGADDELQ